MKSEVIKIKLVIKQYLCMIIPYLTELINEKNKNSNEHKLELSMVVNFMCITDKEKNRAFHVKSDHAEIRLGNVHPALLMNLLTPFCLIIRKKNKY